MKRVKKNFQFRLPRMHRISDQAGETREMVVPVSVLPVESKIAECALINHQNLLLLSVKKDYFCSA